MRINGEAIHGAESTPFGVEFTGEVKSKKVADELNQPEEIKSLDKSLDSHVRESGGGWDWRCTTKPGKIYIHLIKWPGGKFVLPAGAPPVKKARLLADPKATPLAVSMENGRTAVALSASAPDPLVSVLCLEVE
jgi:alpha-L-fucosidase